MNETAFYKSLVSLPNGSYHVLYKEKKYLLTKATLLEGKLIKVYAERLDQIDIISGNYYTTIKGGLLKPCEMSDKKVIDFVLGCGI